MKKFLVIFGFIFGLQMVFAEAKADWSMISTGNSQTCALTSGGNAYCWGSGTSGELGTGERSNYSAPVAVDSNLTFQQIAAGFYHGCALSPSGKPYCWGWGKYGQIGNGDTQTQTSPAAVNTSLNFQQITAGLYHNCGLTSGGKAYCWGEGDSGRLGNGDTSDQTSPVAVDTNLTFQQIVAGNGHTCALTNAGQIYCWGDGNYGQLGDSDNGDHSSPVAVNTNLTFQQITAGRDHTCALTSAGKAYCWGWGGSGRLGSVESGNQFSPVAVNSNLNFNYISAGSEHTCGIASSGQAYCWGAGRYGRIGDGDTGNHSAPVAVAGGISFQQISAGNLHTCAKTSESQFYCWGRGNFGQIGDGDKNDHSEPQPTIEIIVDFDPPLLSNPEIATSNNDLTPDFQFESSEEGIISYLGSCTSTQSTAILGTNIITFEALTEGIYDDCGIVVTDSVGNVSETLAVPSFEVDTTAPVLSNPQVSNPTYDSTPDLQFTSDEAGTISFSGSCSSEDSSAIAGINIITLKSLDNGIYDDCVIFLTDAAGNLSEGLAVPSFEIGGVNPDLVKGLMGRVTDFSGKGIPNAVVQVVAEFGDTCGTGLNVCNTKTDADGYYNLLLEKGRNYIVNYFRSDYFLQKNEQKISQIDTTADVILEKIEGLKFQQTSQQTVRLTTDAEFERSSRMFRTQIEILSASGEVSTTNISGGIIISSFGKIFSVRTNNPNLEVVDHTNNTFSVLGVVGRIVDSGSVGNIELKYTTGNSSISGRGLTRSYNSGTSRIGIVEVAASGKASRRSSGMKRESGDKSKDEEIISYEKSKILAAAANAPIPGKIKKYTNRNGFEIFAGYQPGRIGLERFEKSRFQNPIKFRGSATSESLQSRYDYTKSQFQNLLKIEVPKNRYARGIPKRKPGQEVISVLARRAYLAKKEKNVFARKNLISTTQTPSRIIGKNPRVIKMKVGKKSVSVANVYSEKLGGGK